VLLNNTVKADRSNFRELVFSEGYDTLLMLYTTEVIHDGQRSAAMQFNLVADAFIKLNQAFPGFAPSFRVVSYDVNVYAFPEGIDFTLKLPQIMFFPAYDKRAPYRKFTGETAIAGLMLKWVQKLADIPFEYPVDVSKVGYPREQPPPEEAPIEQC
jgi:hypothetical protein